MRKYSDDERELIKDASKDVADAHLLISGAIDEIQSVNDWYDDEKLSKANNDLLDARQSLESAAAYIKEARKECLEND
jgi:hypothetical protein